ncbi:hypothetical protein CERSUDRAFT_100113 [Gelatoporia subvermispora B]|uniref:Uncharacterized protein n=1 Tax=Ceriporiopsis subvermispora (strain B) TaxID=914234 RepID=M2QHT2_CERS8|nr:hypothetical protein CERSUDRAFT_100113 [Gelatoporia subvermispora B]
MAANTNDRPHAERAQAQLLGQLDDHVAKVNSRSAEGAYAREFRANVELAVSLAKDTPASRESRLICNAGVAAYSYIGWVKFFKQLATKLRHTVEHLRYNIRTKGTQSMELQLTRRALLGTKAPTSASGNGHAVARGNGDRHAPANDHAPAPLIEDDGDAPVLHYLVERGVTRTNFAALPLD